MMAKGLLAVAAGALFGVLAAVPAAIPARADSITATLYRATMDGPGEAAGTIVFSDHGGGLLATPDLHGLGPGPHGMHIHEKPACGPMTMDGKTHMAGAAGGHYDPGGTGAHRGPYGDGHLGDLPNLIAEADGTATIPVLAPRPGVSDIRGRAVMVHAGADRYAAHAQHGHGKGGMRMYCGVIGQ